MQDWFACCDCGRLIMMMLLPWVVENTEEGRRLNRQHSVNCCYWEYLIWTTGILQRPYSFSELQYVQQVFFWLNF